MEDVFEQPRPGGQGLLADHRSCSCWGMVFSLLLGHRPGQLAGRTGQRAAPARLAPTSPSYATPRCLMLFIFVFVAARDRHQLLDFTSSRA